MRAAKAGGNVDVKWPLACADGANGGAGAWRAGGRTWGKGECTRRGLSTVDEGEADEGDGYLVRVATAKAVGRACPPLFCTRVWSETRSSLASGWSVGDRARASRRRVVRQERAVYGEPWNGIIARRERVSSVPAAGEGLIDLASRRLVEMCLMWAAEDSDGHEYE